MYKRNWLLESKVLQKTATWHHSKVNFKSTICFHTTNVYSHLSLFPDLQMKFTQLRNERKKNLVIDFSKFILKLSQNSQEQQPSCHRQCLPTWTSK